MKKQLKTSLTEQAMQALTDPVTKVIEDHRRRGMPLAIWRNGKAVSVPATDTGALYESPTPCKRPRDKC